MIAPKKITYFKCRVCCGNYTLVYKGACTECETINEIVGETAILINSVEHGAMVAYEGAKYTVFQRGEIVGKLNGRAVYLFGKPPTGYTPAQLIVMCTPAIEKLGNEYASYVTYSNLPKRKKNSLQLEMFLFMDTDDDDSDDDDSYDDDSDDSDDDDSDS